MPHSSFTGFIITFFMLWFSVSQAACLKERRPSKYFIPEGYIGWVRINYLVKEAPPIPIEDGYEVFRFTVSGELNTSSDIAVGQAKDEYYYYSADGKPLDPIVETKMIRGHGVINEGNGKEYEIKRYVEFFIGPDEEYRKSVERMKHGRPTIGPIKPIK